MTVQPGRRLAGLTFDQVEAEVNREWELVKDGAEFEDNLHHVKVFRAGWEMEDALTAREFLGEDVTFSREDIKAEDWIFHDTIALKAPSMDQDELPDLDKKLLSRDDVQVAVSMALGRFYYSNPDSHKIVPEVMKRLGFG